MILFCFDFWYVFSTWLVIYAVAFVLEYYMSECEQWCECVSHSRFPANHRFFFSFNLGPDGPFGPRGPIGKLGSLGPKGQKGDLGENGFIGFDGPPGKFNDFPKFLFIENISFSWKALEKIPISFPRDFLVNIYGCKMSTMEKSFIDKWNWHYTCLLTSIVRYILIF